MNGVHVTDPYTGNHVRVSARHAPNKIALAFIGQRGGIQYVIDMLPEDARAIAAHLTQIADEREAAVAAMEAPR